jgi:hypothetical protein
MLDELIQGEQRTTHEHGGRPFYRSKPDSLVSLLTASIFRRTSCSSQIIDLSSGRELANQRIAVRSDPQRYLVQFYACNLEIIFGYLIIVLVLVVVLRCCRRSS